MGTRVIFRYSDFSENAIGSEPEMVEESFGTSEGLWSYATTRASGGSFGYVVQKDYVVTSLIIESSGGSQNASVRVFNNGNNVPLLDLPISVADGRQTIVLDMPISVKAGQCIALNNSNVYFCEPNVQAGDYPTNSYDGLFMTPPYRCFRMTFIGYTES